MSYLSPGTILDGRYEILSRIGEGATGVVYKARHQLMNRLVAVKMLHHRLAADEQMLKRFQQEAKAASALTHPHIISVHDFAALPGGEGYLVMDFLAGSNLSELLKASGPLAVPDAVEIFSQCCAALAYAHRYGIVHRDIKPGNIFLAGESAGERSVKLVDFGIAKIFDLGGGEAQRLTQTGEVFGSPIYMSPEQAFGKTVDARSDIYSLGCVMYECLTGSAPHLGSTTAEIVAKHKTESPQPFCQVNPDVSVPGWLENLVFSALEKDAAARPQSADELKAALELGSTKAGAVKQRQPAEKSKKAASSAGKGALKLAALVALVLLVFAGCFAVWLTRTDAGVLLLARLALTFEETKYSSDDPRLLGPMRNLMACYLKQGNYDDAVTQAREILNIVRSSNDPASIDELLALGDFASTKEVSGKHRHDLMFLTDLKSALEAKLKHGYSNQEGIVPLKLWQSLLTINRKLPDEDPESILRAEQQLAMRFWALKDRDNAIAHMQSVVDALPQLTQLKDANVLVSIQQLAGYYNAEKNYAEAEKLFNLALQIYPTEFGVSGNKCDVTAQLYSDLAYFKMGRGKLSEARADAERALSIWNQRTRPDYGAISAVYLQLAEIAVARGDLTQSEIFFKRSLELCADNGLAPDRERYTRYSREFAIYFSGNGRFETGRQYFQVAIETRKKLPGDHSHDIAVDMRDLGQCWISLKDNAKAERLFSDALALMETSKDKSTHDIVNLLHTKAGLLIQEKRFTEAEPLIRRAVTLSDNDAFTSQPERVVCLDYLSQVLAGEGRENEAKYFLARARSLKH